MLTTVASTQDAANQAALQRLCGRMNWLNFSSMLPPVPFALLRDLHIAVSADKEKASAKLFYFGGFDGLVFSWVFSS